MSTTVIEVNNISKKYKIGQNQSYYTLRDTIAGITKASFNVLRKNTNTSSKSEYWALKDISFKVNEGEVLGIIGPNGSGKSTLLKILSKITPPTKGIVRLNGRVGSLLEVGTGVHPELTGRENIYLNGAILGMSRKEISRKFDEIVDFSGIEKFIDTPVKRYSSGMIVRLGFAVAAHLEPEILLLDEVLAVGDAEFQKKSLGKIGEVANDGRTVLFVSHNLEAIQRLSTAILYLNKGSVKVYSRDVAKSIGQYLGDISTEHGISWVNKGKDYDNKYCKLNKIFIGDINGKTSELPIRNDSDAWMYFDIDIKNDNYKQLIFGYFLYTRDRILLYKSLSIDQDEKEWPQFNKGKNIIKCMIPKHLLNEGDYYVEPMLVAIADEGKKYIVRPENNSPTLFLEIFGGLSNSPVWTSNRGGLLAPVLPWEIVNK